MKETFDYYYDLLDEYCDNKIGYWEIQSSKMNNIQKFRMRNRKVYVSIDSNYIGEIDLLELNENDLETYLISISQTNPNQFTKKRNIK